MHSTLTTSCESPNTKARLLGPDTVWLEESGPIAQTQKRPGSHILRKFFRDRQTDILGGSMALLGSTELGSLAGRSARVTDPSDDARR